MITKAEAQALYVTSLARKQQEEEQRINTLIENGARNGETYCCTICSAATAALLTSNGFSVVQDPDISCKYEIRWDNEQNKIEFTLDIYIQFEELLQGGNVYA